MSIEEAKLEKEQEEIPASENETGIPPVPEAEEISLEVPQEESEVEKLRKENAELKEKLIYLQADYQNYRKRTAKDISDARSYGQAAALEPFLTINDFLGMAKTASEKSDNLDSLRQGLDMIIAQFIRTLDECGVTKIDPVGQKFDPELHEAVSHEHSAAVAEGVVIKAWNCGYKLGGKLLRPAKVVVSAGPEPEKKCEEKTSETAEVEGSGEDK